MEIIEYKPQYQRAFKRLNVAWIESHWQLEAADHHTLDHPEETIIAPGGHIFLALAKAVIDKARLLGAERVYLESNTILEPAIALHRKLGFRDFAGEPSPYERCNIQMVLELNT